MRKEKNDGFLIRSLQKTSVILKTWIISSIYKMYGLLFWEIYQKEI